MPVVQDLSTKACFKPENARRATRLPSGKYYELTNIAEAILKKQPGRRFNKSYFSIEQNKALARVCKCDDHIWCNFLSDNNDDERVYWYDEKAPARRRKKPKGTAATKAK
jgi:hypothetical protein